MAKINISESDQLGMFTRLDRWCRRILPGYNYIRNKQRNGSRVNLKNRGSISGIIVPAKLRRLANRIKNRNESEITDEIYVGAGISRAEFCKTLNDLLRKKLEERQEQRLAQADPGELVDAVQMQDDKDDDQNDQSQIVRPEVSPEVRQHMIQAMLHHLGPEMREMGTADMDAPQENLHQEPQAKEQTKENLPGVSQMMIQAMINQPGQEVRQMDTTPNMDNQKKISREETCSEEPLSKKPRTEESQQMKPKIKIENEEQLSSDDIQMEVDQVEESKPTASD